MSQQNPQPQEEFLQDPTAETLEDTYRRLPSKGRVVLSCRLAGLSDTLKTMETVGFVGMVVQMAAAAKGKTDIIAYKAKTGPCYETGKDAGYLGAAAAALDDDNHLVFESLRVCEKTAGVYQLPPYRSLMKVTGGDPALLARLGDDPVPFDCNTYEADFARLLKLVPQETAEQSDMVPLFYPGPFRLLVLKDGALLRRGQTTLTARRAAAELIDKDGCIDASKTKGQQPVQPHYLAEAYKTGGASCLLEDLPIHNTYLSAGESDFSALDKINDTIKEKLLGMIENNDPSYVLVGSNPSDPYGCCPSVEVGISFKLVEAGVLDAFSGPTPPDGCPVSIFSFAGELNVKDGRPEFTTDDAFRQKVLDYLEGKE